MKNGYSTKTGNSSRDFPKPFTMHNICSNNR
jgi:hypothetical protein